MLIKDFEDFLEKNNFLEKSKKIYIKFLKNFYENNKKEFLRIFENTFDNFLKNYQISIERFKINKNIWKDNIIFEIRLKTEILDFENDLVEIPFYYYLFFDENFNLVSSELK